VSARTAQRETLGRFLRLAEFAGTTPYEQLYQNAGGQAAQRDSFTRTVMRHGYIEFKDDGTVLLTPRGREESRRLMQGKGL
jgi:hypothetical protein